ncbi:MAG: hypothetical protein KDC84_08665 [Crocinitomicaceae bacterium]|nr:hypothetical protein [Crocinitomicaceae bacterium]
MEDNLDNKLDIGFVNYKKHPSNQNYVVFRFKETNMADFFRSRLEEEKIWFEEGLDELKSGKKVVMFGVHKTDYSKAQKINYETSGKHRKPFIADKALRYTLMTLLFGLLALAIYGVIKVNFL